MQSKIVIPKEVFNEIEAGKNKEYYTDLSKIEWIKIKKISNEKSLLYFLDLDKAEVIVLANGFASQKLFPIIAAKLDIKTLKIILGF